MDARGEVGERKVFSMRIQHCADCQGIVTNDPESSFCRKCFVVLCGLCADTGLCQECASVAHNSRPSNSPTAVVG